MSETEIQRLRRERDEARELAKQRQRTIDEVTYFCELCAAEPGVLEEPSPRTDGLVDTARQVLWLIQNSGSYQDGDRDLAKARALADKRHRAIREVAYRCAFIAMEPGCQHVPGPLADGLSYTARQVLWLLENNGRFSKHPDWHLIHRPPYFCFMAWPLHFIAEFERMTGPVEFVSEELRW